MRYDVYIYIYIYIYVVRQLRVNLVYDFYDGSAQAAIEKYRHEFPNLCEPKQSKILQDKTVVAR